MCSKMNIFKDEHSSIKLRTGLQKPDFRYLEFLYFWYMRKVPSLVWGGRVTSKVGS